MVTKVMIAKSDGLNLILRSFLFKQVIWVISSCALFCLFPTRLPPFIPYKCPLMCLFCLFWGVGWLDVCIFNKTCFFWKKQGGQTTWGSKTHLSEEFVVGRLQMFVPWGMVAYSGSYRYAGRTWANKKRWWWRVAGETQNGSLVERDFWS